MDPLRGIPPLIVSLPVTEPVARVSERRDQPEKKRAPKREAATPPEDEEQLAGPGGMPSGDEDAPGQHVDTEA